MSDFTRFKIGEKVRIIDKGQLYTTYNEWVWKHAKEFEHMYVNDRRFKNGTKGRIVVVELHGYPYEGFLCLVKRFNKVFLIHECGLERVGSGKIKFK